MRKLSEYTEAFAIIGEDNIIDVIDPDTRLSAVNGENLEQIRDRYPNAQIVNLDAFCADKASRQDTEIEWVEVTQERYATMLNVLPPAAWVNSAFLVGEPTDHHAGNGQARYSCLRARADRFFESSRPITRAEFKQAAYA